MKLVFIVGFISTLIGWGMPAYSAESMTCESGSSEQSVTDTGSVPLPVREGPRTVTSGKVPHVQIGVKPVADITDELRRLAFSLPGVESRPTIVSLPGATGMWLKNELTVAFPKAIVSGREFSHIHSDGSLHTPLPLNRALELAEKGWGERHPWAEKNNGWEGLVMLYTPITVQELEIVIQLITESYNHVTGQNVPVPSC